MKKKTYGKLTPDLRKNASKDLTAYYLGAINISWRYFKILANKKVFDDKYNFFRSILIETNGENDEAIIAQEITNGYLFDTISQCVLYIEDLFALIKASDNPDYFIRNIVTYSAGTVSNFIKVFNISDKNLKNTFHVPHELKADEVFLKGLIDGIEYLRVLIDEIKTFYSKYEFFHNQYKHGLTLALRPFGNKFDEAQIQLEKEGQMPPFLAAFDNFNLKASSEKGTFNMRYGAMMPGLTNNVMPILSSLHDENNYLRFVFPPDPELNMGKLVNIAKKVHECLKCFVFNYYHKLTDKKESVQFKLLSDFNTGKCTLFTYASTD